MYRLVLLLIFSVPLVFAEPLPGWEGFNNQNKNEIDHSTWQMFLDTYLRKDDFGQTYFDYAKVNYEHSQKLGSYIHTLEAIDPLVLNANEQKAYWINFYNALTVKVILDEYPVKSIRNIGGSFGGLVPTGPWSAKRTLINNQELSLDDIEHGIVRPKYNDYRVHFAFNCAAKGCPNLAEHAYTSDNIEALLQEAETSFINHQRGVRFQNGKLVLSKIFDWYQSDFVTQEKDLPGFLASFAKPKLRAQLRAYSGKIKYEYDWSLNEVLN